MLKTYDVKMTPLHKEDKKIVHQQALWHKVVTGILFNKKQKTIYFQTIYPKESYTFERPDYIDFSIGGHVEEDETVETALKREAKEELDLKITDFRFLGIRVCNCDLSPTYHIREFQYFYAINTEKSLCEMSFLHSDKKVKSVIEMNIDDVLSILLKEKEAVNANEMVLDKETRQGTYLTNILLSANRIIPDYYTDKSIFEKLITIKSLIEE